MGIRIFIILAFVVYTYQESVTENTAVTTTQTQTSFSCEGRVTGYYADVETGCRTYHYCFGSQQYTYQCPNNTLFQQRIFICNHWYLVDCGTSEQFYSANLLIGQRDKPFVGEDDAPLPPAHPVAYHTTQRIDVKESTYYDDAGSSFSVPDSEDFQRVETTTTKTTTVTTTISATATSTRTISRTETSRGGKANAGVENDDDEGFIRLKFTDPRGLFYIPNGNNSVETFSTKFREFVIPRITGADLMQFKVDGTETRNLSCPKFCDPRYVRPGTCHPCIMIK